jgi:hypothetical protein
MQNAPTNSKNLAEFAQPGTLIYNKLPKIKNTL